MSIIPKIYKGVFDIFGIYWQAYGGWQALFRSFYLHVAVLCSAICYPIWMNKIDTNWYEVPISIIPNLLGFTLGGYAILLAFGSEKFIKMIAGPEPDGSASPYMEINAAFIHFLIVQSLSLLVGIIGMVWELKDFVSGFLGFTLFLYVLTTLVAACMAVFRVAGWFDKHMGDGGGDDCDCNEDSEK